MREDIRAALRDGISNLDDDHVFATVRACLEAGDDAREIIAACEAGMRIVGERYEQREYFLSGLIMAGEIFRGVMEIVGPALQISLAGQQSGGRVLIGTVKGDIHDIGKGLLVIALRAHGFNVEDLGVNVPPQVFADRNLAWRPDLIGLSGLITASYSVMRDTVQLLHATVRAQAIPSVPILIGGGVADEQVRQMVGADYWCGDALEGVRLCQRLMAARHTGENPSQG